MCLNKWVFYCVVLYEIYVLQGLEVASYLIGKASSVTLVGRQPEPLQAVLGTKVGAMVRKVNSNLYYNSPYLCRCSQTAGRNSCSIVSGDVSNCSYRLIVHPVTSSRLSSA